MTGHCPLRNHISDNNDTNYVIEKKKQPEYISYKTPALV